MSNLLALPDEILQQIVALIPYHTLFSLRRTCHRLQALATDDLVKQAYSKLKADLLAKEIAYSFSLTNQVLTTSFSSGVSVHACADVEARRAAKRQLESPQRLNCYQCLRNIPATRFPVHQTRRARALGRRKATERTCIKCALRMAGDSEHSYIFTSSDSSIICHCKTCGALVRLCSSPPLLPPQTTTTMTTTTTTTTTTSTMTTSESANPSAAGAVSVQDNISCGRPCASVENEEWWKQGINNANSNSNGGGGGGRSSDHDASQRATRCQKCWATDHTDRIAQITSDDGQHWCLPCHQERVVRESQPD